MTQAAAVTARGPLPQTSPKIRLDDVRKTFSLGGRQLVALAGIDLAVQRGEFLCIVGPSGCGKTTLLRMLGDLESATSGRVEVIDDARSEQPLTSMVFQQDSIYPWLSVRDNVAFGLKARGLGRFERDRIAERFIVDVGLGGFEDALPHQLSGGMQQRVGIARAFANDPQVLLLDEPFSAVDEQTRLVLQEDLLRLWATTGKTVVYVTHSIDEAIVLADRIVIMSGRPGRITDVVDVTAVLGRSRPVDDIRSSPRFGQLYKRIWDGLRTPTSPHAAPVHVRVARASWRWRPDVERMLSIVSPITLLAVWELAARNGVLDARFFPAPSRIVQSAEQMLVSGELWMHLSVSLLRITIGWSIGTACGVVLGLAMGLFGPLRTVLQPIVDATFPIPKIALLPLFIIALGIGEVSRYAIIATAVVYIVLINTLAGVRNIGRAYVDVGRHFKASRPMRFTDLALPGALPLIVAGLRLSAGVALLILVSAEFVGAKSGLGYLIWTSWQVFQIEKLYVGLVAIAAIGVTFGLLLSRLERAVIRWKPPG